MKNKDLSYENVLAMVQAKCVPGDLYDIKEFDDIYNNIIQLDTNGIYYPIGHLLEVCEDRCVEYCFEEDGDLNKDDYIYDEWDRYSENAGRNIICEDDMLINFVDIDIITDYFF